VSRSDAPYGMVLDRGLTIEQLDLAFEISRADPNPRTNRRRLTVALRDLVSDQEAEGKTKKCLSRIWLNPPAEAAPMIDWAREHLAGVDRRALHFGAILATFPFVGVVARVIGQHLQTEAQVKARRVREEVRRSLGDRSSVDVGARKTYTTLRNLGLLSQVGQQLQPPSERLKVSDADVTAWLSDAVLLTRKVESLSASTIRSAPELFGLNLAAVQQRSYPFLDAHTNDGQLLLAARRLVSGCVVTAEQVGGEDHAAAST
jgi:hypothetical protein